MDILSSDYSSCSLEDLRLEIQEKVLRSYPLYRRRCNFFSLPTKNGQKASETPGQVLTRVKQEAKVAGVGEQKRASCPTCTCSTKCVKSSPQDMTYSACVTAVWMSALRSNTRS